MSHVYDHVVLIDSIRGLARVDNGPVRPLREVAVRGVPGHGNTVRLTLRDDTVEDYENADVGELNGEQPDKREGRGVYTARPAGRRTCACVKNHVPVLHDDEAEGHHVWPIGEGGPDKPENMRWLCPITHTKVHNLWRAYQAHGGTPPNAVLRRYSSYVRDLVADGWRQAHPTPSPEV